MRTRQSTPREDHDSFDELKGTNKRQNEPLPSATTMKIKTESTTDANIFAGTTKDMKSRQMLNPSQFVPAIASLLKDNDAGNETKSSSFKASQFVRAFVAPLKDNDAGNETKSLNQAVLSNGDGVKCFVPGLKATALVPQASLSSISRIADLQIFKGCKTIVARVLSKSALSSWSKGGREGLVFHLVLSDSQQDSIKANFFADEMAYNFFQESKTYKFSGGGLKTANTTYSTSCTSPYEFTFSSINGIEEVLGDSAIDANSFEASTLAPCTKISELERLKCGQRIQATISKKGELYSFNSRRHDGCVFSIDLEESSGQSIRGKFFNDAAERFYERMEESKLYLFGGFSLRNADHGYDDCTSPLELRFEQHSTIELV